jgi:hypothetical protein
MVCEQQIRDTPGAAFQSKGSISEPACDAFDFPCGVRIAILFGVESDDV